MQKSPYWMMIGGAAGFFIGVAVIMLITADYSIDNVFCESLNSAALPSMPLRTMIVIICMAAGMLTGLIASLFLSKMSPDTGIPII